MSDEQNALNGLMGQLDGLVAGGELVPLSMAPESWESEPLDWDGAVGFREKLAKVSETAQQLAEWVEGENVPDDYDEVNAKAHQLELMLEDLGIGAVAEYYALSMI